MTSASKRITAVLALAAALSLIAARTSVAEVEPYLTEYRAYTAALESGNADAAATHARAAWQAAEQTLGDHQLTGILAFNYGRLITFSEGEKARAPMRRASALQEAGVVDLPPAALRLYSNYAEFAASGFEEKPADRLRDALNAAGMRNETLNRDIATMWLSLASQDVVSQEYRKAVDSAAKAEAAIRNVYPDASHALAEAILLGAISRLVPKRRSIEDAEAAREEFERARRLFQPQKDLDNFDPLLARIVAWESVASSALYALYQEEHREPPDRDSDDLPPFPRAAADGTAMRRRRPRRP